jgi:CRP-like cAMP-binding protein
MAAGPHASLISAAMQAATDRPSARDWANVLSHLPLFARVSKRHIRKVAELAQVRDFERGEFVIRKGDEPDGFYVVLAGNAKVAGKPAARPLGPGDHFGEIALLDNERRTATVVAASDLQTMRIPRAPFMRLLKQEPSIAIALLGEFAARVRRLERSIA